MSKYENDQEIQRFREYLRIKSVHPNIDYGECVEFFLRQAKSLGLPTQVHEIVPKKPVAVMTWEGLQPELPSILLSSHMDVVPVYEEHWTYPPFDAHITKDGVIHGRGTQDMKGVGMAQIEAVRRLKEAGVRLKRTIHICFTPDEEIGSADGMRVFSESEAFKNLNVGFGLDESGPNPEPNVILAHHGERTSRQIKVTCRADPAHGMLLTPNTAGEKLHYIMTKFMELRAQEKKKFDSGVPLGEVTTVNVTKLEGGVLINVQPECLSAYFDIRVATHVDHQQFENTITKWCEEAGEGVSFEYLVKNPQVANTKIDGSVVFWNVLEKVTNDMGYTIKTIICPGATDARLVRNQGIPAIGFSPFPNTPLLLHAHDERLSVDVFKKGIDLMTKVVEAVANA